MSALLDLKRMRYVVEVARAEGITSAAKLLHISQPALTRNIQEVEEELGVQLFHRLSRGVQLTEEGKDFVSRAKRILEDVDDLALEMSERKTTPSGRLRIGAAPAGYLTTASRVLRKIAALYPDVVIETSTGSPQALCPGVLRGELDVVVGSGSYLGAWREIDVTNLVPMQFAAVFRGDHPIKNLVSVTEMAVLSCPIVMPASIEPLYTDIAKRYFALGFAGIKPRYVTDDLNLALGFVSKTDAFYPLTATEADMEQLKPHYHLVRNVVQFPQHHVSLGVAHHRPGSAVAQLFCELMTEDLGRL